jgi:hypothetical protein
MGELILSPKTESQCMPKRQRWFRGPARAARISISPFRTWSQNRDLREVMGETEIDVILESAKEKYPEAKPRINSDHAPQFIARDFKKLFDLWHDACPNLSLLSPIERENRALGTNR